MKMEVVCLYEILIYTYQTAIISYNLEDNNMNFHCQKTSNPTKTVYVLWITNDDSTTVHFKTVVSGCLDRFGTQENG